MDDFLNKFLDQASHYFNRKPGLLPLIAILLIILNFVVHVIVGLMGVEIWFASSNLLLHLGLIIGLVGILLIRPLE
jgi:hypothetical protein